MLARLRSFLGAWTRRERFEDTLDDEVRFHLEACTEELVRAGVPRPEAARRARVQFGGIEGVKDDCRRARGLRLADELERTMTNVRLGFRMLFKTPLVTGVAVVSLALGIGANAAIFSLYSQFLLRPLPVVEPERLVNLDSPGPKPPGSCRNDNAGGCDHVFSYPMFRDLERGQTVFSALAAHRGLLANVAYRGRAVTVRGTQVSGSYFPALGLRPAAGRLFGPEVDEAIGGHPMVVLSHDFWQTELEGSPDVIGDALVVNGQALTVVGVAPAGFRGTTFNMPSALFVPITMRGLLSHEDDGGFEDRRTYWTYLFARLAPGVSIDQARAALDPLYRSILAEVEAPLQTGMSTPETARFLDRPLHVRAGRQGQSGMHENRSGQRAALFFLFGITAAVLLIACANVVNLLLARSAARTGEMAVRLALGASRRHLLAQLLTESCLLAALAGAAGLVAAHWTLRLVWTLLPPLVADIFRAPTLDPYVVLFTAAVSLATAVVFGIFPALYATRGDPLAAMKDVAERSGGTRSAARFRHGLVVAQLALATTLLAVGGLFILNLHNVDRVDPGFRTDDVATFLVRPELNGHGPVRSRALYDRIRERLSAQPGVVGVTAASRLLLDGGPGAPAEVRVEGVAAGPDADRATRLERIGTDYFRTLGIPLLLGRTFSASDTLEAPKVAIVNESFAREFDLGRDAVGRRIGRGGPGAEFDIEIVGLVGSVRRRLRDADTPPVVFVPYRQEEEIGGLWFYVRSSAGSEAVVRSVPAVVAAVDPNLPAAFPMPLSRAAEMNTTEDRMAAGLLASFAALATLLAAVGLYGVLAYAVAQRTREIGLRMALGADAARLRAMVLGQVGRMALAGGALGLAAAFGLGRALQSLLYEIEGMPPAVVAIVVAGLAAVAVAAGLVPAHRAARVDPMEALRHR